MTKMFIPNDLGGDAEPRPLLARGDGDRLSFPGGLTEDSGRRSSFLGGVVDILFISFLGEWEPEELLPDDEAERERLLQATKYGQQFIFQHTVSIVEVRQQGWLVFCFWFSGNSLTCGRGNVCVYVWSWCHHAWGGSYDEGTFSSLDSVFYEVRKTWIG